MSSLISKVVANAVVLPLYVPVLVEAYERHGIRHQHDVEFALIGLLRRHGDVLGVLGHRIVQDGVLHVHVVGLYFQNEAFGVVLFDGVGVVFLDVLVVPSLQI